MHNERCMSGSASDHAKPAIVRSPRRAWSTPPYIRTWEGWLYLAVVMDLFSRKIVGWATRPTIHRELVLDAVMMAVDDDGHAERLSTPTRAVSTVATIGGASAAQTGSSPA
jgi:transposase InsO family protein